MQSHHIDYKSKRIVQGRELRGRLFFSSMKKFDGTNERFLSFDEISQIAGRAGRNKNQGFFGITGNLKKLENNIVSFE